MNETKVVVVGNVVNDPTHVVNQDGMHIARFRLASTPRRWDKRESRYVDGDTSFFAVSCFRSLAQNVASSVRRGDPVVVAGTLKIRDWEKEDKRGTSADIDADGVGHDLARGVSTFRRTSRTTPVPPGDGEARRPAADGDVASGLHPGDGRALGVDPVTGEILDAEAPAPFGEPAREEDAA